MKTAEFDQIETFDQIRQWKDNWKKEALALRKMVVKLEKRIGALEVRILPKDRAPKWDPSRYETPHGGED